LYEVIVDGKMPMPNYLVTHPEARLTDAEKAALADGLLATTGASSGEVESDHDSD
jgi:phenylpyruvate tautomerase PptA (4-oxalocrotonate tautomerase family)